MLKLPLDDGGVSIIQIIYKLLSVPEKMFWVLEIFNLSGPTETSSARPSVVLNSCMFPNNAYNIVDYSSDFEWKYDK